LSSFVNSDPTEQNFIEGPESPSMQAENQAEEYQEYMEFEAPKKGHRHIVKNGEQKSNIDAMKNLEKMNLPASLKERFGVS